MKAVPRTIAGLLGAAGLGLMLGACGSGPNLPPGPLPPPGPHADPATVVFLQNYSFVPALISVAPGQTVEWVWQEEGNAPGNVTSAGFASPTQTTGTYYHTFEQAGTFDYSNTLRDGMTGEVVVNPS